MNYSNNTSQTLTKKKISYGKNETHEIKIHYQKRYLKKQNDKLKALFSNPDLKFEELDACVKEQAAAGNVGLGNGYGLSKCALTALTLIQAKAYPNLKVVSLSPGFIDTPMTKGHTQPRLVTRLLL